MDKLQAEKTKILHTLVMVRDSILPILVRLQAVVLVAERVEQLANEDDEGS